MQGGLSGHEPGRPGRRPADTAEDHAFPARQGLAFVALLQFLSGACALVYQLGWLRELRLAFGASTYATSAVLAIFMGGLGAGALLLGRTAERATRALRLYGLMEVGIAATAVLSPFALSLVRGLYLHLGGAASLGPSGALGVRLVLSFVPLAIPAFLMGGTLPAAVRAVASAGSGGRVVGVLYGANTLGAVCGALGTTFVFLERLGTRRSLLLAAAVSALVGVGALVVGGRQKGRTDEGIGTRAGAASAAGQAALVTGASAALGFTFFLMEIVWYRMLAPLFGGSAYTFGVILAVVLLGIGVGGLGMSPGPRRSAPTFRRVAVLCGLEATGIALAYGLGDRVAVLAASWAPSATPGLLGRVLGWGLVCGIVVAPASLAAGYLFPLLVGVAGRNDGRIAGATGRVYAWSTAGSVVGALAGGFWLLPRLGALGCWRLGVAIPLLVGACAALFSLAGEPRRRLLLAPLALGACAIALVRGPGPTAAWRHNPIAARGGRLDDLDRNQVRHLLNERRFHAIWEAEGIESSVGLLRRDALAFTVNGRIDGNARGDAGTQVMSPLIAAALHPAPGRALVIGLGTGSTAGWLAAVDTIKEVTVVELEPAMLEVARQCEAVNRSVLANPNVRLVFGDGREVVLTSKERYDLIFSEPSNPYRAGIASLYTQEFYRAAAERLAPGGIFSQWVQVYEVDEESLRIVHDTLRSVFPAVEVWWTSPGDILFTCSLAKPDYPVARLRGRLASEPFRTGMLAGWGVAGLESFLGSYLGSDGVGLSGPTPTVVNTDDRMLLEFRLGRSQGRSGNLLADLRSAARTAGVDRPAVHGGAVDWERAERAAELHQAWQREGAWTEAPAGGPLAAYQAYAEGRLEDVVAASESGAWSPVEPLEVLMLAEALADRNDSRAWILIREAGAVWPGAAAAVEARMLLRQNDHEGAIEALERAFRGIRTSPWEPLAVMRRAGALAEGLAMDRPEHAQRVFALLTEPFSVRLLDAARIAALVQVSRALGHAERVRAIAQLEPNVYWKEPFLRFRLEAYEQTRSPLTQRAREDLAAYLAEKSWADVLPGAAHLEGEGRIGAPSLRTEDRPSSPVDAPRVLPPSGEHHRPGGSPRNAVVNFDRPL